MSGAARSAIVEALSKLDALTVTPTPPAVIHPYSAWPVWASTSWRNACVADERYYVIVALPATTSLSTIDAGDELSEDIATALWAIAQVGPLEPWSWPLEQGNAAVPALRFTLTMTGV